MLWLPYIQVDRYIYIFACCISHKMIWCFINKFVQLKKVLWVLMLWYRYVNIVHCFGFVSKWLVSIRFILKLIQSISNWLAMLSPKMCHLWLSGYGSCTTKIYKLDALFCCGFNPDQWKYVFDPTEFKKLWSIMTVLFHKVGWPIASYI